MKAPVIEEWLNLQNVKWHYWESVPLARIDAERSLKNQARLDRALDEPTVAAYAQAMRDKAAFPALIAYALDTTREKATQPGADLVLITGNHRMAAAMETGRQDFDVYVVEERSPTVRERMTRTANFIEGRRPPPEEALQHAVWLVTTDGYTAAAAARMTNLKHSTVELALRADRVRAQLLSLGVDATQFPRTTLTRLSVLKLDAVLAAAGQAVRRYRLAPDTVGEMLRSVQIGRSEAEQLDEIRDFVLAPTIAARAAMSGRDGRFTQQMSTGTRVLAAIGVLRTHVARYPDPRAAGVRDADEFQAILDRWAEVQTAFGLWANKGRRLWGPGSGVNTAAVHGFASDTEGVDAASLAVRSA